MSARGKLYNIADIYTQGRKRDEIFLEAMRENCAYQYEHCKEYREILDKQNFHPDQLREMKDLADLPFITTAFFKKHKLESMPKKKTFITATSSGTSSGVVSEISYELSGLLYGLKMILQTLPSRKMLRVKPYNYIMLCYKPNKHNQMAVTKSFNAFMLIAPSFSRTYALTYKNGKYEANLERAVKALCQYATKKLPVRIMGFPAYAYFLMKMMKDRGIALKLPKESQIIIGGGWKQYYREEVDKSEFYALAKEVLGLEDDGIVELFSAVEHPVSYVDCKKHHFHIPVYSRVMIRDVNNFRPIGFDKVGLVNLMTPMIKATPILSVMTDDLGILHRGSDCGCGATTPYLEIIGRVGLKEIKTCAAGAAKLLDPSSLAEVMKEGEES